MLPPVLAIDGPSGAGKGTVSRLVAKKLGWHYLDSGSIYRALAIAVLQKAIDVADEAGIVEIARTMELAFACADGLAVTLDGNDITHQLSLETTGNTASMIAVLPAVRAALLEKQHSFRRMPGLVADGRDMGTVVFPDAPHKIFLTASAEKRAERRYKQLIEKGVDANLSRLLLDIQERDRRDSERAAAPLLMAADAVFLDTSEMPVESVIAEVLRLINK